MWPGKSCPGFLICNDEPGADLNAQRAAAVLLDLHLVSLQVARSLGRRGIAVYGIGDGTNSIGGYSRFIKVLDAPGDNEQLKDYLMAFADREPVPPVLFPLSDHYVNFLLRYDDQLRSCYRYPFGSVDLVSRLVGKLSSCAFFIEQGIAFPRTEIVPRGGTRRDFLSDLRYPCILKPNLHDSWEKSVQARSIVGNGRKVLMANGREELERAMVRLRDIDDMVVQEFIPGPATNGYYYVGYRSAEGKILASQVGNKVRTMPDCQGSETLLMSVRTPELQAYGDELLARLGYVGPAGIDFKFDDRDRTFKVIEINCRLGINDCYLAGRAHDLACIYYRDAQQLGVSSSDGYPAGVTWYDFASDLDWMLEYERGNARRWFSWWREVFKGHDSYARFAWDDPLPFLAGVGKLARRIAGFLFCCVLRRGRMAR